MWEISRTGVAETDEEEIELTLDLSIGGSFGKSQKNEQGKRDSCKNDKRGQEIMVPRSGFSFSETYGNDLESMSASEAMDSQRKKEIQALRRQEARKKREEKMRKSGRKFPNGSAILSGNAEDKLQMKLEQLKARTFERETRENEIALLELARKNEKFDEFADNNSVKESLQQKQNSCRNGRQRQQVMSNEFLERSLSVVSDHPTTSGKGVVSSSECLKTDELLLRASATSSQSDKPNENDASSSSRETDRATRIRRLGTRSPKESSTIKPNPPTVGGNHGKEALATMPCVSTTGNGPNGKTINGFLYRYSKTDVSIVCVCHGKSHTPAEFVEHAGGVDVTNPLRHITMIPSSG